MRSHRHTAVPVLLLALAALSACGGDDDLTPSKPATDADRGEVLTSGSPTAAATAAPTAAPTTATPSPTASATPAASTPDGVTYALITAASATSLTYDKIDYKKAACDALAPEQPVEVSLGFRTCFSNVNPLKRTAPVSPSVQVTVIREGDPPRTLAIGSLMSFIGGSDNTAPARYSAFKVTVSGGKVTAIDQFGVSFA